METTLARNCKIRQWVEPMTFAGKRHFFRVEDDMTNMRFLFALFVAAALTASPVWAQNTGGIRGSLSSRNIIQNIPVIRPLKNVRLSVHSGQGTELEATTTDENGLFTFMSLSPGLLYINVDAPGYTPTKVRVCVQADVFQTLPIELWASAARGIPYQNAMYQYNSKLRYRPNPNVTSDLYSIGDC